MQLIEKVQNNDINEVYFKDLEMIYNLFFIRLKEKKYHKYENIMNEFLVLLMARIRMNYEYLIVRDEKINPKNIIKSNSNYVEKLKEIVDKIDNSNRSLNAKDDIVDKMNQLISDYQITPFNGFIYNYKNIEEIDNQKEIVLEAIYKVIKTKKLFLFNQDNREENLKLIKIYYQILCDENKFNEFYNAINYMYTKDEDINFLLDNIPLEKLKNMSDTLFFDKEDLEFLFILYILSEEIYEISLDNIERLFMMEALEETYYDVTYDTFKNIDDLYLENGFDYAYIVRSLKEKK